MIILDAELAVMRSLKSQEADWFEEWFGDDYPRIYQHRDLKRMLEVAGLEVVHCFGDYAGGSWSENAPRTILFASRK